jgi:hypothetical protein
MLMRAATIPRFQYPTQPKLQGVELPARADAANFLLWTEALDNPAWTKGPSVSIVPDQLAEPANGAMTADEALFASANRNLSQLTSIAATSGSASRIDTPPVNWSRTVLTAAFDIGTYTLSFYMQRGPTNIGQVRTFLEVAGGFVQVRVQSFGGAVDAYMTDWQLEAGATASSYVPRTT